MNALPEIKNPLASARVVGENISQEEYRTQLVERGHPDFVMSRGELHLASINLHKWVNGWTEAETNAMLWGDIMDVSILTPDEVKDRFAVSPATYTATLMECPRCHSKTDSKSCAKCKCDRVPIQVEKPWNLNATECAKWKEEQGDKQIVDAETWQQSQNALKFFWANPWCREFVECSKRQVMVEAKYHDKDTDLTIPLKCLIDLVPPSDHPKFSSDLGDFKTSRNSEPHSWQGDIFKSWYHVQAALYLDAWNKATGQERTTFRHPVCESPPPWETTPMALDQDYITLGRMQYIDALKRYAQALKTGFWPGYANDDNGRMHGKLIDGWLFIGPAPWMVNR